MASTRCYNDAEARVATMPRHRFLVPVLAAVLLLPAPAFGRSRDAARFAAFATHARAHGTLSLKVSFRGDPDRCSTAGTCGVSGTVSAPLRLRGTRPLRVRGDRVTLPVAGTASAVVRDTVAGRRCEATAGVGSAALLFTGDSRGLLLRPGGSAGDDPFDTACKGPRLGELGVRAIAPARLGPVRKGVKTVRVSVSARRIIKVHGYIATVTTSSRITLRR